MTGLLLYPELTRDELEVQYHLVIAALWQAAEDAVGQEDRVACQRQIEAWLAVSEKTAEYTLMVRVERNRCIQMAQDMAGPMH